MSGVSGDMFIGATVPADTLRAAFARAFAMPTNQVAVASMWTGDIEEARVSIMVVEDNQAGDYPEQIVIGAEDRILDRLSSIATQVAHDLRVPILFEADADDPDMMNLALPDGSIHLVLALQDDDSGIRNTPGMQEAIDGSRSLVRG